MSEAYLVKPDGNCLFEAIPMALKFKDFALANSVNSHFEFRNLVVDYMKTHQEEYSNLILQQLDLSLAEHREDRYPGLSGYKEGFRETIEQWNNANPNGKVEEDTQCGEMLAVCYMENLLNDGVWGGGIEITAISDMWQIEVVILDKLTKEELGTIGEGKLNPSAEKIKLLYNGSHYDVALDQLNSYL